MTERYTIENDEWQPGHVLRLDVDCQEYGRCYVVDWDPIECTLQLVHFYEEDGSGLEPKTHDLNPGEVWQLQRWVECSPKVADMVAEHWRDEREAVAP